jgi:hypothetical protein
MDGDPDAVGDTGTFRVGDAPLQTVPDETTKTPFGTGDLTASSARSVKIQ